MANNQASVLVNKVKPHKDSWKVHVKLLHSWTQNTSYGGETLECGLADQTVTKTTVILYKVFEQCNVIEICSILALAHLRAAVLFSVDISGSCG
ncbi:unnamed protein product [Brassica oleracea var. botrytis]